MAAREPSIKANASNRIIGFTSDDAVDEEDETFTALK